MNPWTAFLIGLVAGWLIEFAIDWFFWRRKTAGEKEMEELQNKLQESEEQVTRLETELAIARGDASPLPQAESVDVDEAETELGDADDEEDGISVAEAAVAGAAAAAVASEFTDDDEAEDAEVELTEEVEPEPGDADDEEDGIGAAEAAVAGAAAAAIASELTDDDEAGDAAIEPVDAEDMEAEPFDAEEEDVGFGVADAAVAGAAAAAVASELTDDDEAEMKAEPVDDQGSEEIDHYETLVAAAAADEVASAADDEVYDAGELLGTDEADEVFAQTDAVDMTEVELPEDVAAIEDEVFTGETEATSEEIITPGLDSEPSSGDEVPFSEETGETGEGGFEQ